MNLLLASYGMPPFGKLSRTDPQKRQTTRNILAPSDFFISFRISRCTGEPADFCSPRADVPKLSREISGRKIDAGSGSPAFQDEGGPVLNKIFSHAVRASVLMPIGLSNPRSCAGQRGTNSRIPTSSAQPQVLQSM